MKLDFHRRKIIIASGLVLLISADAAMAIYSANISSSRRSPQQELAGWATQLKVLQADVERARNIRKDTPAAKRDCDEFENSLLPVGSGYSVVSSELAEIGHKAGLQISSLGFHEKDLAGRGVAEVSVDVTVAGDYKSVVRFLNAMQRSASNYAVDSLALTKESAQGAPSGSVKVDFHVKAYFKAGT